MALLVNITYAPGEPIQDFYDKIIAAINTINLAGGGVNKGVLMKTSTGDFAWTYVALNLDGGAQYKFPRKSAATDYAYEFVNAIEVVDGVRVGRKKITIGTWNMDSSSTINVAHGLTSAQRKTASFEVYVYNDDDSAEYPLVRVSSGGDSAGGVHTVDDTNVELIRVASGFFDSVDFNSTGSDRGYMIITYQI